MTSITVPEAIAEFSDSLDSLVGDILAEADDALEWLLRAEAHLSGDTPDFDGALDCIENCQKGIRAIRFFVGER